MRIRINSANICVSFLVVYSYVYTITSIFIKSNQIMDIVLLIPLVLACMYGMRNGILSDKKLLLYFLCIVFALFRNQRIISGELPPKLICWFVAFLCVIILRKSSVWGETYTKLLYWLSIIHCLIALVFFVTPSLRNAFANLFSGAIKQQMLVFYSRGFLLGITTHYSTLAIYLGNGILITWVLLQAADRKKERNQRLIILAVLTLTMFMIGKRGMILFVAATLFMFLLITQAKDINRSFVIVIKYIVFISLGFAFVLIIAKTVAPQILNTLMRYINGTEGTDFSGGRFVMWKLAIDTFKQHPFLGIGWSGYRLIYENAWYHASLDTTLDVHNVYLQLLCETGIFGFVVYMLFIFSSVYETSKAIRKLIFRYKVEAQNKDLIMLEVSCVMQLVFIFYCLTGNPLYDVQNYVIYFFAVGISDATIRKLRRGI